MPNELVKAPAHKSFDTLTHTPHEWALSAAIIKGCDTFHETVNLEVAIEAAILEYVAEKARRVAPTPRSLEIAQLRALGRTNGEIAAELGISKKTVEQYVWKYGITSDGQVLHPAGDSPPRPPWTPKHG